MGKAPATQNQASHRRGIAWHGSAERKVHLNRSMNLATFLPLIQGDVEWISLQTEIGDDDASLLTQDGRITFIGDKLIDFDDTAALIELMDIIITVDTSVTHLAGAMGKSVWILLPYTSALKR